MSKTMVGVEGQEMAEVDVRDHLRDRLRLLGPISVLRV